MNKDKKYQVFISSTHDDLIKERQKVFDAVLTLYQIPIGMEMFSAEDEDQWEIIKSHIDNTDYYVLIIANRYGSVIKDGPDAGISYTEKEYNYAVSQGVPVLAYLIDESVPVKPSFVEKENADKLEAFKEKVRQGREVVWWKSPEELATRVSQSLCKQILKDKRPGWIRAKTSYDSNNYSIFMSDTISHNGDLVTSTNVLKNKNNEINSDKRQHKESRMAEEADEEKRITELYRVYLEEVEPLTAKMEIETSEYPVLLMFEIQNAFEHLAKYRVEGKKEHVEYAIDHIDKAKLYGMKYHCLGIEDYYKKYMSNHKKSMLSNKNEPDEISKQEIVAKNGFIKARSYEFNDFQRALKLYVEAYEEYMKVRSMIDNYEGSL